MYLACPKNCASAQNLLPFLLALARRFAIIQYAWLECTSLQSRIRSPAFITQLFLPAQRLPSPLPFGTMSLHDLAFLDCKRPVFFFTSGSLRRIPALQLLSSSPRASSSQAPFSAVGAQKRSSAAEISPERNAASVGSQFLLASKEVQRRERVKLGLSKNDSGAR